MEEILTKVQQAFHTAFDVDPHSVGHLELASCLESIFRIEFDVDELMEMENVREIVRIIQSKFN